MKSIAIFILAASASSFLFGCVSKPIENYEKITIGMEKDEVIEHMGSPKFVRRIRGEDRWKYVFYDQNTRYERFVHFDGGRVVYIGEEKPSPSDSSVDDQNIAAEDAEVEKEWQDQYQEIHQRDVGRKDDVKKDYYKFLGVDRAEKKQKAKFKDL